VSPPRAAASAAPADVVIMALSRKWIMSPRSGYAWRPALGAMLLLLPAEAPLNEWSPVTLDLSQWAGRWVMAALQIASDGSVPSGFQVDDIRVLACQKP